MKVLVILGQGCRSGVLLGRIWGSTEQDMSLFSLAAMQDFLKLFSGYMLGSVQIQ